MRFGICGHDVVVLCCCVGAPFVGLDYGFWFGVAALWVVLVSFSFSLEGVELV